VGAAHRGGGTSWGRHIVGAAHRGGGTSRGGAARGGAARGRRIAQSSRMGADERDRCRRRAGGPDGRAGGCHRVGRAEPDIYNHRLWLATVSAATPRARFVPRALSATTYTDDFRSSAAALERVAPQVPLVGPALANPGINADWISSLIAGAGAGPEADTTDQAAERETTDQSTTDQPAGTRPALRPPGLGSVSTHRYPLSACAKPGSRGYPTIARVLGERASAGMAHSGRTACRPDDQTKRSWLRAGAAGRERRAAAGALAFRSA
jgi:hypothetical protein